MSRLNNKHRSQVCLILFQFLFSEMDRSAEEHYEDTDPVPYMHLPYEEVEFEDVPGLSEYIKQYT